ncbi:RE1, partial [Symbiodinium necroappetens]
GGEWESDFIQLLEPHSIHSEFVGSHSPWSNGYAERHGALLGAAVQANVDEKQLTGRSHMKLGLSCACQAKNSVISRGGHSAHFLVFGRQAAYPELLDDEVWARKSLGFALSIEGEAARAAELRAASKVALLRGDVLEKIKRALRRAPAGERYKKDLGCWRGPAVVLMAEGANLKGATVEDANRQDLREESAEMDLAKGYIDMTQDDPPPLEVEAPFSVEGPDLAAKRRLNGSGRKPTEARRMMAGLKSVKKILKGPLDPKQRRRLLPQWRPKKGRTTDDSPAHPPGVPSEECAEEPVPERVVADPEQEDLPDGPEWQEEASNRNPLDDLPFQFRKRAREDEPEDHEAKRVRTTDFANYVMVALAEEELKGEAASANEWLPRSEVTRLGALLDMPLTSVRLHRAPRKRFQRPGGRGTKKRVTVMFGTDPGQVMVAQETLQQVAERPARRSPHLWRGISLFVAGKKSKIKKGNLQGSQLYLRKINRTFVVHTEDTELTEAASKAKANGKELDPRFFSQEEQKAFDEADKKEWEGWVCNHVVEEINPEEAKRIPRSRVFAIPARLVRTNKVQAGEKGLTAKSRIVLPGHLDPDMGTIRTDAPTTQMSAVRLAVAIGLMYGWDFLLFDVSTAFLSGKAVDRDLYVRPPRDLKCVNAAVLWKILKSAYGLSEVPWAPATFVKRRGTDVVAILCLHVDDGFLAAKKGKEIQEAREEINKLFSIKEWQAVNHEPKAYLGMKIFLVDGIFFNDMKEYVLEIRPPVCDPKASEERALEHSELREFRRLEAQLRWPVHLVMPEFLYSVSALAQRVSKAQVKDLRQARDTLKEVQQAAARGQAVLKFERLKKDALLVSFFDASLGKAADHTAQRGEVHFLADSDVLQGQGRACILEFHSNKIARVVRSSLAAEGASMAACTDRLVYNMKLYDVLKNGSLEVSPTWRRELGSTGHIVTD